MLANRLIQKNKFSQFLYICDHSSAIADLSEWTYPSAGGLIDVEYSTDLDMYFWECKPNRPWGDINVTLDYESPITSGNNRLSVSCKLKRINGGVAQNCDLSVYNGKYYTWLLFSDIDTRILVNGGYPIGHWSSGIWYDIEIYTSGNSGYVYMKEESESSWDAYGPFTSSKASTKVTFQLDHGAYPDNAEWLGNFRQIRTPISILST